MPRKRPLPVRELKRYGGSRLYDPESKTYVSVDDVERFRMDGQRVTIRDVETGQDVTDSCVVRRSH